MSLQLWIVIFLSFLIRRPPRSTRPDTLCPYTTLFRSYLQDSGVGMSAQIFNRFNNKNKKQVDAYCSAHCVILDTRRSEEQTSELQSLMRISYAVSCLKQKTVAIHRPTLERSHSSNHITNTYIACIPLIK